MTFAPNADAANAYDAWFDSPWGAYAFGIETRALLRQLGPLAGRRILDVGCGTGRFAARLKAGGADTWGLDLDPAMLVIAAPRMPGRLVRGDACQLPYADESFDAAIAFTLCEFTDDVEAVFAELARVTRPGGCFVVGSLNPRSPWGIMSRRRFTRPPWSDATWLSRGDLKRLGRLHGHTELHAVLYAPRTFPGLTTVGPALELLGRLLPNLGAFQVLTVRKPA